MLGEVRLVVPIREVLGSGTRLGAEDQRHLDVAGGDRPGELRHHLLRAVAADRLEHRARRIGADALRHRPHVVVGRTERRIGEWRADLELPQPDEHLDRPRHGVHVRTGVGQRGPRRLGRQVHRRQPLVVGVVDALGELPDADDDGGTGIDLHYTPPGRCYFVRLMENWNVFQSEAPPVAPFSSEQAASGSSKGP